MSERKRWMLFVDGENLTIRWEKLARAKGLALSAGRFYQPETFVWPPGLNAWICPECFENTPHSLFNQSERSSYYAAATGDATALIAVRNSLRDLGFTPQVFHKERGKRTKRVDITLATDMLSHAHRGNFDVAILVAGDEDYVPLVEELQRLGKIITLAFFQAPAAGLAAELRLRADGFVALDGVFEDRWRKHLGAS